MNTVILTLALGASAAQDEDLTNAQKLELYQKIRSSTVMVRALFDATSGSVGTGVGLQRLGDYMIVVTNSHVVSNKKENFTSQDVKVRPWTKGKEVWLPAHILISMGKNIPYLDIAFLAVHDPNRTISIATPMEDGKPQLGTRIYACGHPQGEEFLVDDGSILAVKEADWLIGHDALIEHGNSGGGLFDGRGRLVGINTWMVEGKYGLTQDIQAFLGWWKFHHARVRADVDAWQDSGVDLKEAQWAEILSVGTWTVDRNNKTNAIGLSGIDQLRMIQRDGFGYGSLLVQLGETAAEVRSQWKKSKAQEHLRPDYTILEIDEIGRLKFRINDKDTSDNTGALDVFVLVVGYAKGYLGVEARNLNDDERKSLNRTKGARVLKVEPYSPAAQAGIQVGDVLVYMQHVDVDADNLMSHYLKCWDGGTKITVDLLRDGRDKRVWIDQHPRQWRW